MINKERAADENYTKSGFYFLVCFYGKHYSYV